MAYVGLMRWMIVIGALAVASCDSAAEKAEQQYKIVAKSEVGDREKCATAGRVKAAWLQERNNTKYREWQTIEYVDCSKADRNGF
jgi:hypothetical protein